MPKPSEFHIGVIEFFSILLPGTLLTAALVVRLHPEDHGPMATLLAVPGANWIAFALTAYAAGHFVFLTAAMIDGPLYDRFRRWRWPQGEDCCYVRATAARKAFFGPAQGRDVPMNTFSWAKTTLRLHAPEALADVERYEADSKFFRSLIVVIPIALPLLVDSPVEAIPVVVVLTVAAFLRYAERRHKSTEWAYRYVVVMSAEAAAVSPDPR